jgi:hypothetical protein
MYINVDYEMQKRWRGKKVTLPTCRKDKTHHAEVDNAEVILNIPENARFLIVHPVTPEKDIDDDCITTHQLMIYLDGEKKKVGDEFLDYNITTFSLDRRLERFFRKV